METAMKTTDTPYLTQEEAADYLRVTVAALRKWRREGYGPPAYQPINQGKVYFRRDQLDGWIEAGLMTKALEVGGSDVEGQ